MKNRQSELLKRLKKNFSERIENGLLYIDVEELADENDVPFRIYFKPLTLAKQSVIYKAMNKGGLDFMAKSLVVRSLDIDGNPMLNDADVVELRRHTSGSLVQKICQMITDKEQTKSELPDIDDDGLAGDETDGDGEINILLNEANGVLDELSEVDEAEKN